MSVPKNDVKPAQNRAVLDMEKHLWSFTSITKDDVTGKVIIPANTAFECLGCGHAWKRPTPSAVIPATGIRCPRCYTRKLCIGGKKQADLFKEIVADYNAQIEAEIMKRTKNNNAEKVDNKTAKTPPTLKSVSNAIELTPEIEESLKADDVADADAPVETEAPFVPTPEQKAEAIAESAPFKLKIGDGKGVELTDADIDAAPMMTPDEVLKHVKIPTAPAPVTPPPVTPTHGLTSVPGASTTIDGRAVVQWDEKAVRMAAQTLSDLIKFIAEKYAMEGMPPEMAQANAESIATVLWMYRDYLSANQWVVLVFVLMRLGQTAFWASDARKRNIKKMTEAPKGTTSGNKE